jgi:hypothetical protein
VRCQVTFLMALYLKHAKGWAFAKQFILAGGLRAMVDLVVHPNLHLRGQAMEALSALTSEELFPWHEPPRPNTSDVALHQRMLELAKSPLIPNLTANFEDTFPGGSHFALQLLAFYASWLRLRHCPGNVLRLSADLIGLLGRWQVKPDRTEEEKALAKALYDDFSRYDAASASSSSSSSAGALPAPMLNGAEAVAEARAALVANAKNAGAVGDDDGQHVVLGMDQDDTCRVVADRTLVLSAPASTPAQAGLDTTFHNVVLQSKHGFQMMTPGMFHVAILTPPGSGVTTLSPGCRQSNSVGVVVVSAERPRERRGHRRGAKTTRERSVREGRVDGGDQTLRRGDRRAGVVPGVVRRGASPRRVPREPRGGVPRPRCLSRR